MGLIFGDMETVKSEYISHLENQEGIFSLFKLTNHKNEFYKLLKERKTEIVHEIYETDPNEKLINKETLFKTTQNFYIHVVNDDNYFMNIYYKPQQFNELMLFVGQMKKNIKNATTKH